ncbi:MAG TPA: phosphatidylglycerophosphatase A [Rubrivivax sp.]|nr:phosphatidylglycerophosphatase A [Burkholderiales bacterium]HNT38368.1 phosphatidylglycerophosphatase A [Rubrivivax sp.]
MRADLRFMLAAPAHLIALGLGSGLAPRAPGTAGTLWAWLVYLLLAHALPAGALAALLLAAWPLGWWACTRTAQHLGVADPGAIVWDEVAAFWLLLWLLPPAWWVQALAFVLFRLFDALKPGPVGWADRRFKLRPGQAIGWAQGAGILLDDLVAALCCLPLAWGVVWLLQRGGAV